MNERYIHERYIHTRQHYQKQFILLLSYTAECSLVYCCGIISFSHVLSQLKLQLQPPHQWNPPISKEILLLLYEQLAGAAGRTADACKSAIDPTTTKCRVQPHRWPRRNTTYRTNLCAKIRHRSGHTGLSECYSFFSVLSSACYVNM